MLSMLAYHDRAAVVKGLDDFPADELPPVPVVHMAFQVMVGAGTLLTFLSLYALVIGAIRRAFPTKRLFLWLVVFSGPLAWIGLQAGWVVTEVGRQPWIVHQVARTADMVTGSPYVGWSLGASLFIYAVIAVGTISVLRRLALVPVGDSTA